MLIFITNSSNIPTDYIFWFANSGLTSATNWTGGTLASPSLYTLLSSNAGVYTANFESLSYKALRLKNGKDIHIDFSSSINKNCIKGELFEGVWSDVGTPERLNMINLDE